MTNRERLCAATDAEIRELMLTIAKNGLLLLEVVAAGRLTFRNRFLRDFRGLAVDGDVADRVFAFFCRQVVQQFGDQPASALLDQYVPPPAPPTEAEIEAAWEWDGSGSSEDGRRTMYRDGGPAEFLRRRG